MRGSDEAPRITRRGVMLLGLQAGVIGALGWRMRDLPLLPYYKPRPQPRDAE